MPYSPGVSYNPGYLAQGIASLGQGLADGIVARRKKEEEKKKKEQATVFARQILPKISPEFANADDKTIAAGIDAVGIDNVLGMAQSITQAEQQRKTQELQQQQIKQAIAAQQREAIGQDRNRAALIAASDPASAGMADAVLSGGSYDPLQARPNDTPEMTYIGRGGDDPRHMAALNNMAAASAKRGARSRPELMDLGNGVRGVWDGNNFSRVPDPKAEKDPVQTANIGGRNLTHFGGKIFDESGEVVAPDKPLDPITGQMLLSNYQATISRIQNHREGMTPWGKKEAAQRLAAEQEKANYQAEQLGFQKPFPKVGTAPEADADEPSGKPAQALPAQKGPRRWQNGHLYELDPATQKWVGIR